jgi:hypothetical protein
VQQAIERAGDDDSRRLGEEYVRMLDDYAAEAKTAGAAFVELQNTMLFATVGQRAE